MAASADLKVEEAYYWRYSQNLAPGYFDHPPMVAWLIALVSPLGHHPLVVRLPSILLFSASAWLLYLILERLWDGRAAAAGVVLHSLLPAFSLYSLMMLPDSPLMFFWCLGIYASVRLIHDEQPRWWWLIGLATGLGMDSKYPAVLIPLGAFLSALWLRKPWRLSLNGSMLGAAALALLLFGPVIYWNVTHDFASFRFQGAERFQESTSLRERMASLIYPALMLGPLVYLAGPWILGWAWGRRRESSMRLALAWTLPFMLLVLAVSSKRLVAINWPLPGYLGFLLLLAPWVAARPWRWALILPAGLFTFLSQLGLLLPLPWLNAADDVNQWKKMTEVARQVQAQMPRPQQTFFLGYGYQAAAHLTYAGIPKDRVVSVNAIGFRGLAYDYWLDPRTLIGQDCVLVAYSRVNSRGGWSPQVEVRPEHLNQCFVSYEGPYEVEEVRGGRKLRLYRYWKCFHYLGPVR